MFRSFMSMMKWTSGRSKMRPNDEPIFQHGQELGRGTFGIVTARSTELGSIAVKQSRGSEKYGDLIHEAQVVAQAPVIGSIATFNQLEGICITSEILRDTARDRRDVIVRSPHSFLRFAEAVASNLSALHSSGIAHGDVSIVNIMFDRDDSPFLIDLSCSRSLHSSPFDSTVERCDMSTMAWSRSPDECFGAPRSEATDAWSFGAVLATLLTGQVPRCTDTIYSTFANIVHKEIKPIGESWGWWEQTYLAILISKNPGIDKTMVYRIWNALPKHYQTKNAVPGISHIMRNNAAAAWNARDSAIGSMWTKTSFIMVVNLVSSLLSSDPENRVRILGQLSRGSFQIQRALDFGKLRMERVKKCVPDIGTALEIPRVTNDEIYMKVEIGSAASHIMCSDWSDLNLGVGFIHACLHTLALIEQYTFKTSAIWKNSREVAATAVLSTVCSFGLHLTFSKLLAKLFDVFGANGSTVMRHLHSRGVLPCVVFSHFKAVLKPPLVKTDKDAQELLLQLSMVKGVLVVAPSDSDKWNELQQDLNKRQKP